MSAVEYGIWWDHEDGGFMDVYERPETARAMAAAYPDATLMSRTVGTWTAVEA